MLKLIPNSVLQAQAEAEGYAELETGAEEFENEMIRTIMTQWDVNRRHREDMDPVLTSCQRMRSGQYSSGKLSAIANHGGGSTGYLPIAAMQCVAASAKLGDILLPSGHDSWDIETTPVVDLSQGHKEAIEATVQNEALMMAQQGQVPPDVAQQAEAVQDETLVKLNQDAEKAMKRMKKKIQDQLVDSDFRGAMHNFLDDITTYPTAVMKTIYIKEKKLMWGEKFEPVVQDVVIEKDIRVSPFDAYPSPGAVNMQDGAFIERMRLGRDEIAAFRGVKGYRDDVIDEILDASKGMTSSWLNVADDDERNDSEGQRNLDNEYDSLIDALHFWGPIMGKDLIEWGEFVEDPYAYYPVEAIVINRKIIRAVINADPLGRRPYYKASWRNKPGSWHGISICMQLEHVQDSVNGATRAISNNMGVASGPQIILNLDALPQDEEVTSIEPLKVWQVVSPPSGSAQKPVDFYQPQSNAKELMGVMQFYWELAGEITGIQRYTYGADQKTSGAAQTASGMSMLLEGAEKTIKACIKNIDETVIEPRVTKQYQDNMLYEPDQSLKGDLKVVAIGTRSLTERAVNKAKRSEFMAVTANANDQAIMGPEARIRMLQTMAEDLDMPGVIPSVEEVTQRMAQQQQQQQPEAAVQAAQINYQSRIEDQKFEMQDKELDRQLKREMAQMNMAIKQQEMQQNLMSEFEAIKAQFAQLTMKETAATDRVMREIEVKDVHGSGL